MKETGDSTTDLRPSCSSPTCLHHRRRRHRRRCFIFGGACLLLLVVLGVAALVLYLLFFNTRDPTTELVSTRVEGVSPRVTFPALRVEINITLGLDVLVHNPNRAAFDYAEGHAILRYRGVQVGDADIAPGRIPVRGDGHVQLTLRVEADKLATDLGNLAADLVSGELAFDSSTRIPGRLTILGFIKLHAVAKSECHVTLGVMDLKVRRQECTQKAKV